MKLFPLSINISLVISWIFLAVTPAFSQSGNQSDITGPDPFEIIPWNETTPSFQQQIIRDSYESRLQESSVEQAIELQEEFATVQFTNYLGVQIAGAIPSVQQINQRLLDISKKTGKRAAFIQISTTQKQILTFGIIPQFLNIADQETNSPETKSLSQKATNEKSEQPTLSSQKQEISQEIVLETVKQLQQELSDPRNVNKENYLKSAQQIYKWFLAPLEDALQANKIEILVFEMDSKLRTIPIAALHDGQQFLIEKYAVALVPTFGLTDTRYFDMRQSSILTMGASEFSNQKPLPAVPIELQNAVSKFPQGVILLNQDFTLENFLKQNQEKVFLIIHLGTHAEFQAEELKNSYIQFSDQRLTLTEFREIPEELGWLIPEAVPRELLVLSACQTALGDEQAELGFAGLALLSGFKSVLASLWKVSDVATLALMTGFYQQYNETPIKSEALQKVQLGMLKGEIFIENKQLHLKNGQTIDLPTTLTQFLPSGRLELSHPYYWSAFTLIGNWN